MALYGGLSLLLYEANVVGLILSAAAISLSNTFFICLQLLLDDLF